MEDDRGKSLAENGANANDNDKFPIGMRVLIVDDDITCLKVLEQMLWKCQYEVTSTDRATKALIILRENRDKFDLIISDVKMPDMDGFQFLEHVGLEMDLPVIMLSAYGDRELVMKGVIHGACDYLVKPVRMEELRNIWQHVVRKKIRSQDQGNARGAPEDNDDRNAERTRKRRDQGEGEGEDQEETVPENDDPSTQKKPRVVWSVDLHKKFVAAVEQLGVDKAVPKRILELMNMEGITRENVASHLQKYRLYLKRVHPEEQAPTLASGDSSVGMPVASLNAYRDFSGPGMLPSIFTPGGSFGRLNLNSPSLSYHGMGSSALTSSTNTLGRIQPSMLPINLSCNLSINQFNPVDCSTGFAVPSQFPGNIGGSIGSGSNDLMFQGNTQQSFDLGAYGSASSNWHGVASPPLPPLTSNSFPFVDPSLNQQPTLNALRISSTSPSNVNSLINFPSTSIVHVLPEDSLRGIQSQDGLLGDGVQATPYIRMQSWQANQQGYQNLSYPFNTENSMVSSANVTLGSNGQYSRQLNAFCSNMRDAPLTGQSNGAAPSMQSSDASNFPTVANMPQNDGFIPSDFEPMDDWMSMIKKRT